MLDNITVNTQSSIKIRGSRVIYFDPFQIQEESHDADLIFLTHSHYDHFDPESILKVAKGSTKIILPDSMKMDLGKFADKMVLLTMKPNEQTTVDGIHVHSMPAYNKLKPFHPKKNGWLGYVFEIDGAVYYIAGDTDALKELETVRCNIAFVPIGGTYTMNASQAAGLANAIRPDTVVPIHYRSIVGGKEDADDFGKRLDSGIQLCLKL